MRKFNIISKEEIIRYDEPDALLYVVTVDEQERHFTVSGAWVNVTDFGTIDNALDVIAFLAAKSGRIVKSFDIYNENGDFINIELPACDYEPIARRN